jgi:hypothetical protein
MLAIVTRQSLGTHVHSGFEELEVGELVGEAALEGV